MRDMNLRDMKMRHHVAGVENARHEFAAPTCSGPAFLTVPYFHVSHFQSPHLSAITVTDIFSELYLQDGGENQLP